MSQLELQLSLPEGRVGPHREPGCCQFCGGVLRGLKCTGCGNNGAIDCRRNLLPCEHVGCVRRGEVGVDLHDVFDGHDLHVFCDRHCPECNGVPTAGVQP